jgi:hypothetical protein
MLNWFFFFSVLGFELRALFFFFLNVKQDLLERKERLQLEKCSTAWNPVALRALFCDDFFSR